MMDTRWEVTTRVVLTDFVGDAATVGDTFKHTVYESIGQHPIFLGQDRTDEPIVVNVLDADTVEIIVAAWVDLDDVWNVVHEGLRIEGGAF